MSKCPPIPRDSQIYWLDTLDWSGFGGRHYVGKIGWEDGADLGGDGSYHYHEIERSLSLKEAKALYAESCPDDPDTGARYWKLGLARKTNRFETREDLERVAGQWVREHCKLANWLLIDNGYPNPNRPIAAHGWYGEVHRWNAMKDLAAIWDKVPNHLRDWSKDPTKSIYSAWHLLLTPPKPKRTPKAKS